MTLPNRLSAKDLDYLSPADLRELPVSVLADLQAQLNDMTALNERRKGVLWARLNELFADPARRARLADAKDTGTVHLQMDGYDIACSTSKRVDWDNAKLLAAISLLSEDDQKLYLKYKLSVAEEKFQHAPSAVKALLEPARTMKPSKETFTLTQKDG